MRLTRGLEKTHEQNPLQLIRDTRTLGQRIVDFLKKPTNVTLLLIGCAGIGFFMPSISDLILVIGSAFFWYAYTRKTILPFRMPLYSGSLDYNDISPSSNKPCKARGIYYVGNEKTTNEELWFSNEDMRTHILIFGSTGSGKTETLISLACNALIQGSGFIYVDGKGDNSLYAKIFSMVRRMGREDDILLINFMTGARDIVGPQEKKLSNTMNPFANGSSSMLSQLVVSLLDGASPDGDMWKGRAIVFVEALMKVLVYMRDMGAILLDVNTVRNYFELSKLEAIVIDKQFIRDNQDPVSLAEVPSVVTEPIINYIINLPGYDKTKKGKQVSQVLEQHGFITMQLIRVFGSLADTYGHILRTKLAEVDLKDVVLNRRILVVLLPVFEKSLDELANLGKIIVSSLKTMLASGLGEEVEGDYRNIIQRKLSNSPTPYLCILDEYGYYAVKGFAVVPAQARSLGFSIVFAGQDLPAFQKASKEEALSIGANCNIKICMKLEDPLDTWDYFNKTAGESYVTKVDAFQNKADSFLNNYTDTRSSSAEKRARIDLLDLKEQHEGEAHIFFKSRIIRAKLFYANPKPVKRMRLNQLLRISKPLAGTLIKLEHRLQNLQKLIAANQFFISVKMNTTEINLIAKLIQDATIDSPIERAVQGLMTLYEQTEPEKSALSELPKLPADQIDIYTPLTLTPALKASILTQDYEKFASPLLDDRANYSQITNIEKLSGQTEETAQKTAAKIIDDIRMATHYPLELTNVKNYQDTIYMIHALRESIQAAVDRQTAETNH